MRDSHARVMDHANGGQGSFRIGYPEPGDLDRVVGEHGSTAGTACKWSPD